MDMFAIRQDLTRYREEQDKLKRQYDVVAGIVQNLEKLLSLSAPAEAPMSHPVTDDDSVNQRHTSSQDFSVKGSLPFTHAILQVLRDAQGEPLTIAQILERSQALGARTDAKRPYILVTNACTDWQKKRGQPLEKVGTGTWRWAGPVSDESDKTDVEDTQLTDPPRPAVPMIRSTWETEFASVQPRQPINHA